MSPAEEKIRAQLAGDRGIIHFQHEGADVVRWLAGGVAPEARVILRRDGSENVACCPQCRQEIGRFDASYGSLTGQQIGQIRYASVDHRC